MAIKIIKRYQENAVRELLLKAKLLLEKNIDKRTIVFQSPTGSGKTFMMAKCIQQFIKDNTDSDFCFIWISIGKGNLQTQSFNSLRKEFNGFPDVCLLEREFFGSRETIEKNEVVVVNWEKLRAKDNKTGEWKNILMKDKETTNFRELIRNTKENDIKIIMIIDESHVSATTERALELRDQIVKADLSIEMSATPVLNASEYNEKVIVFSNDVIEEGMIKKEIIINEHIDEIGNDDVSSQELILESAFRKREQLKQLYKKMELDINPLVLIQLPSSTAGEDKKEFVERFLAKKNITYNNQRLAIWLSEEKVNNETELVTPNDSDVDFLIFKQAIDTGWDCPRASILVRFREIRSIVFEIQTIGRILRMPEAKHYRIDELNKGYIYTNVKSLEVRKETYNPNIIKSILVKRNTIYKPLKLKSYYRNRIDFGDITLNFYKVLERTFCDYFELKIDDVEFFRINENRIRKKIDIDNMDNKDEIILNKSLDAEFFDKLPKEEIAGREASLFSRTTLMRATLSQVDLFHSFEFVIKMNLNGFAIKRSTSIVKQALYRWFRKYLNVNLVGNGIIYIQTIVLNNVSVFSNLLDKSVRAYKPVKDSEIIKRIEEIEEWNDKWEIAENRNLNPYTYQEYNYELSLYRPCYLKIDSRIENSFIEFLERKKSLINWWWQNGNEHMSLNFGIKYNKKSTFQPDFLVLFKDGQLGIFDTKTSGYNEKDNKLKAEALQVYIKEEGRNIFGGLIIKEGQHFRINMQNNYKNFEECPNDWEYFEEVVK